MRRLRFRLLPLVVVIFGCAGSCSSATTASPTPDHSIDVVDFIVGDQALWPRVGNHYANQIVDQARHDVCWVKYVNPQRFECWRWDDAFVYHDVDHAIDGDVNESYRFSDGRWLPRRLDTSWSLDIADNRIVWFGSTCQVVQERSHIFPYRQRAWLETRRDAGGDLGVRDTLVLEYAPYDPISGRSIPERFYFARGAGWYEWQRETTDLVFNRRGGPAVAMNRSVLCP